MRRGGGQNPPKKSEIIFERSLNANVSFVNIRALGVNGLHNVRPYAMHE